MMNLLNSFSFITIHWTTSYSHFRYMSSSSMYMSKEKIEVFAIEDNDSDSKCSSSKNINISELKVDGFNPGKRIDIHLENCKNIYLVHPSNTTELQLKLIDWYKINRRKLPWRGDVIDAHHDLHNPEYVGPYGTWVSEIMLQQTRVETVIPYWYKWMKAFPTVFALEQASVEQVHALWAGLGYYSRARRLLEGAKEIVKTFDGVIPDSVDLLKRIPGIGPYTAGAIASIAYNKQEPLVDGNVIRVFSRLRAIEVEPGPVLDKICWSIAADIIDPEHPSAFNQGLMELGATVCKPTNPLCDRCPLSKICDARGLLGTSFKRRDADMEELFTDVTYFPLKKPKKEPTKVQLSVCVFSWKHPETFEIKYLFLRRPATGLLALQWEFPSIQLAGVECDDEVSALPVCTSEQLWTAFPLYIKESVGLECVVVNDGTGGGSNVDKLVCSVGDEVLEPIVHIFSHQIHNMHVFICDVKDIIPSFAEHGEGMKEGWRESRWMSAKEIVAAGITSGCKKVLAAVSSSTESKNSKKRKPHPGNGGTENKESSRSMEKWLKKLG